MATRKSAKRPRSAAQLANDAKLRHGRAAPSAIEAAQGFGDEPLADPLAALMADPKAAASLASLIEAAVAARLGQAKGEPATATSEMGELAKTFGQMLEIQAMQMPGYFKPLPAEVVQARAAAQVEMFALLRSYKDAGTAPRYYIGPGHFYAGAIKYEEGQPIDTFLPPPEDFLPCYDGRGGAEAGARAALVLEAQLRMIGGHSPDIATRVSEAEAEAHSRSIPLVGNEPPAIKSGPVQAVEGVERREVSSTVAFSGMGETVVPGLGAHQVPRSSPGRGAPARGPAFVE